MRMRELRRKEVINVSDGGRLGFVGDVELHLPEGQTAALSVFGPARFFGLFGKGESIIFRGTVSRESEMTSFSSISLFSAGPGSGAETAEKILIMTPFGVENFGIYPKFPRIFSHFLKIILAIVFLLCYNNQHSAWLRTSLFVPVYKKRVSRGEEAARGTN